METYLFLCVLLVLSIIEATFGFISIGVIKWWNYLTRSKIRDKKYWDFKRKVFGYNWSGNQVLSTVFLLIALLVWLIILMVINSLVYGVEVANSMVVEDFLGFTNYLAIPLAALLVSPLLRWIIDVSRNLRIKKESGVSEEIAELKSRIKQLENK